jgi:hypothetical protein
VFVKGVVVGLVCALLGGAAVALAGSGVGGIFNLGQSNSVDAKSTLIGASPSAQLQVTNTSTTPGSAGLGVSSASSSATGSFANSSSGVGVNASSSSGNAVLAQSAGASSPALVAKNTGGGPAASFAVNAGLSPFKVNSSAKVQSLNADQLDGLDSAALQKRVNGSCATGTAVRVVNPDGSVLCQAEIVGGETNVLQGDKDMTLASPGFTSLISVHLTGTQVAGGRIFYTIQATDGGSQIATEEGVIQWDATANSVTCTVQTDDKIHLGTVNSGCTPGFFNPGSQPGISIFDNVSFSTPAPIVVHHVWFRAVTNADPSEAVRLEP